MWNDLSMAQKSELMKMFIQNGVYDLNTIIKEYDSRHQSGDEATLPNYSQNVFAEGGNIDDDKDNIDNRTGKPRYRRDIHNVNITSSSENDIEGAARDTSTIGPLAFYPPKYYIGKQVNQFAENPNVTYDSWFDEHPEMIDVMTDIVGRYNNRLNNRGQQLPQLNRFYFEKLYNPEDDPIIHEAIERMLQAKWNRDVRTYNDNRTLNLWDTVEKFPAANTNYAKGGHLYQGYSEPTQKMRTLYDEASDQIYGMLPEINISAKAPKGYKGYPMAFEKEYSNNGGIYGGFRNKDRAYQEWQKTQKYFSPENLDKYRWEEFKPFAPLVAGSMAAPAVVSAGAALAPVVAESAPIIGRYATKFGLPLATAITGGKTLDDFIARNGDYSGFADWANQTLYRENATPENEEVLEFFNPGYAVAGIPNATIKGINAINRAVESTAFGRNARITSELNKAIRNTNLSGDINIGNKTLNKNTRFKVGDVELGDPSIAYRQGSKEMIDDFINTGVVRSDGLGASANIVGKFNLHKNFENPMFMQGNLWYGVPEEGGSRVGLLTTREPLQVATKTSNANKHYSSIAGTSDVQTFGLDMGRRIPLDKTQLNLRNTTPYIFDPNYGYRRIGNEIPTLDKAMQAARNARIEKPWNIDNPGIQFIRALNDVPIVNENGFVELVPKNNMLANFATDMRAANHHDYKELYEMPSLMFINESQLKGITPFSIKPSDTFFEASQLKNRFKPQDITYWSYDERLNETARSLGFNVPKTPKALADARDAHRATFDFEGTKGKVPLSERLAKTEQEKGDRDLSEKANLLRRQFEQSLYRRPSLEDYKRLETKTGLKADVTESEISKLSKVVDEYKNAKGDINKIEELYKKYGDDPIVTLSDGASFGHDDLVTLSFGTDNTVADKLQEMLDATLDHRYDRIYYDKASPVEYELMKSIGMGQHPKLINGRVVGAKGIGNMSLEEFNKALENLRKRIGAKPLAKGGQLGHITPYGQWQYPHQVTTIPSNNITMQGVNYPIVGVSDTGDTKVMLPGLDYLYDGNYVTEYPV